MPAVESTSPGARELHEIGLLLVGGGLDAGNIGAPLLAVAWRAIPKAERTPDAVRALAEGLRAEGARLGEGVLGRWWGPDEAGAMMLLDRRLIDRLGALGAKGDAAEVEKGAEARWARGCWGAGGPLDPWLVRLPARSTPERPELATLARVRGLDPATGRVEAGAGPDGLTWIWLWNEALRRGRITPADAAALARSGAGVDERAAPPAIRDAVRALEREIVEAAGESTGDDWTALRWLNLARALWPKVKAEVERQRHAASRFPVVGAVKGMLDDLAAVSGASTRGVAIGGGRAPKLILSPGEPLRIDRNPLALAYRDEGRRLLADERIDEARPYYWAVLYYLLAETRRRTIDGEREAHIIQFRGGYDGVRKAMGLHHKGAAAGVRAVLYLLHNLTLTRRPGEGGLLTVREDVERGGIGRPREIVTVEIGLPLRPDAPAHRVIWGDAPRWVVALVDPRRLPVHGNSATTAAQRTLAQRVSLYAHERRDELLAEGGWRMTLPDFARLGRESGLYEGQRTSLAAGLLTAWTEDDPPPPDLPLLEGAHTGPLLTEVGRDLYRFTDKATHEHMLGQAELSRMQATRGRSAAKARAPKRSKG